MGIKSIRALSCIISALSISGAVTTNVMAETVTAIFDYTGTIQTYTVGAGVSSLIIEAEGAQGGGSRGGLGASITGTFNVNQGDVLSILVGGQGFVTAQGNNYGAGGGGGTFVYLNAFDLFPLIAAGGGGGQSQQADGGAGSATVNTIFGGGISSSAAGGINGNGGSGGQNIERLSTAGGGAGWLTDGQDGLYIRNPAGEGGSAVRNGGAGGVFTHSVSSFSAGTAGDGGYGGGGSMSDNSGAGGGGGGYNGGGGGNNYLNSVWGTGGGGGSYNGGYDQLNLSGISTGNGVISISSISAVPIPAAVWLFGSGLLGLIGVARRKKA